MVHWARPCLIAIPDDLVDEDEGAITGILGIAEGSCRLHPNVAPFLHHPAKVFGNRLSFVEH